MLVIKQCTAQNAFDVEPCRLVQLGEVLIA